MTTFKAGDVVICIAPVQHLVLGREYTVKSVGRDYGGGVSLYLEGVTGPQGWFSKRFKLKEEKQMSFSKKDLKTGMKVKFRNGAEGIVMLGAHANQMSGLLDIIVLPTCGWVDLTAYNEDLTYENATFTIVKVFRNLYFSDIIHKVNYDSSWTLVWERVEETPEQIELKKIEQEQRDLADRIAAVRERMGKK